MKMQVKESDDDLQIDMSPMIDMVFMLLLFFIVASQIVDEKPRVAIPPAKAAKVPEELKDETRLMISVSKDDEYYIFNKQLESFDEVTLAINEAVLKDPKVRVLIRADGDVPYKTIEKINIECALAGACDIIYAATEETQ